MAKQGKIHYVTTLDNDELLREAEKAKKAISGIGNSAEAEGARIDNAFRKAATGVAAFFTVKQAADFAKQMVNVRGEIQGLEISFKTMLESKKKADEMMAEIHELALKSPYTLTEVADNTKQLIAMGIAADKAIPTMKMLGDVSAGLNVPMSRLAINYGQVFALGKLQTREIRDFAMAGVPIVEELSQSLGKTTAEIYEMVEAGKIGFPEVEKAFTNMTSNSGKFNDMMTQLNSSVSGQISKLKDEIELMFNDMGEKRQGMIYSAINGASLLVENYQRVADAIAVLVTAYGTYKAALIATAAIQKATVLADNIRLVGMFRKELGLLTAAQQAFNLKASANPYILLATVITTGIVAISRFTKAKREEEAAIQEATKSMRDEFTQTNILVDKLKDANLKEEDRKKILDELKAVNPKIVEGIEDEASAYEILSQRLEDYNKKQMAAIAVKQFSLSDDFDEAVTNLSDARQKLTDESAGIINIYSELYTRLRELVTSGKDIPDRIRQNLITVIDSDLPETEKVRKMFDYYRSIKTLQKEELSRKLNPRLNVNDINSTAKRAHTPEDPIYSMLDNIFAGLSIKDYQMALGANAGAEQEYLARANALKEKIRNIAAAVFADDEAAKQDFIDSQFAIYFPEDKQETVIVEETKTIKTYAEQLDEARKAVKLLKEEIAQLQKGEVPESYTKDKPGFQIEDYAGEIDKKQKALKEAEGRIEALTGVSDKDNDKAAKRKIEAAKYAEQIKKEAESIKRATEDRQYDIDKAQIEAMQDGFDKRFKTNELNYKHEMVELQRQREDYIAALQEAERTKWESDNPEWQDKGLVFTPTVNALPDDATSQFTELERQANLCLTTSNKQVLDDMLDDYRTYEQRKQKIRDDYDKTRKSMSVDGKLRDGVTQGNIDELNRSETEAIKAIDIEISQFAQKNSESLKKVFGDVAVKTKKDIKDTITFAENLLKVLTSKEYPDSNIIKQLGFTDEQIDAMRNDSELINNIIQGIIDKKEELTADDGDAARFANSFKEIAEALSMEDGITKTRAINEGINNMITSAQSLNSVFGSIASTLGNIAAMTDNDELSDAATTAQNVLNSLQETLSMAASGAAVGGVYGAIIGGVIGLIGSLVTQAAEVYAKNEEALNQVEVAKINYQSEYNLSLIEQNKLLEEANNIFKVDTFGQAMGYVSQAIDAAKYYNNALSQLQDAEIITGSHTEGALWWEKQVDDYEKILDVYPQIIDANGELDAAQLQIILNCYDMDEATRAQLEGLLAYQEALDEARENLRQYLSDTFGSLGSELVESIDNAVLHGEDALEKFSDSITKVLQNFGKQLMYSLFFAEAFKTLQKQLEDLYMAGGDPEQIGNDAMAMITEFFNGLDTNVENGQNFMEMWYNKMAESGYIVDNEVTPDAKGFQAMSQESADEMNGRFTTIQGHTFNLSENSNILVQNTTSILNLVSGIKDNTDALGELSELQYLDGLRQDMSSVKATLADMQTRGIKIRN